MVIIQLCRWKWAVYLQWGYLISLHFFKFHTLCMGLLLFDLVLVWHLFYLGTELNFRNIHSFFFHTFLINTILHLLLLGFAFYLDFLHFISSSISWVLIIHDIQILPAFTGHELFPEYTQEKGLLIESHKEELCIFLQIWAFRFLTS